jgi:hypothetical protein
MQHTKLPRPHGALWNSLVIPFKPFGPLALSKPVLYARPEHPSVTWLIRHYGLGCCLDDTSLADVTGEIACLSTNH